MVTKYSANQSITILQLLGQPDSGQTTLAKLFVEAPVCESTPVLVVENTQLAILAKYYGVNETDDALLGLLEKGFSQQVTQDTRDWLLDECVVDLFPQHPDKVRDLLWIGELEQLEQLSSKAKDWLSYTLPRLFSQYSLLVVDGNEVDLEAFWPNEASIRTLLIIKPGLPICQSWLELEEADILLSQALPEDGLPQTIKDKVQSGQWRFVGRIPPKETEDLDTLYGAFKDCFMRLNLPISLT
jgi:hypothetical protein